KKVRVYDLNPFPSDEKIAPTEMLLGDILDFQALCSALEGCDTVFHLAANPQLWDRNPEVFDKVNRKGTENVIQAAKKTGIRRLIYTSTESILAKRIHKGPINEKTRPLLGDMIGPYCRSKFLAEQAVFRAGEEGLHIVVVNPTMPIGPGDRNLTPPGRMISQFLKGKIPCYINCTLNFVDVRDVALGHLLAAEKGQPYRRYILSGHNLTLAEFFFYLAQVSGRPAPRLQIPYFLALTWSYVEEWIGKLSGRIPQSSVTGVKLCRRSLTFDGSMTWQQLGHTPRPIEESVSDAVNWFLSQEFREVKKTRGRH
ncbi:MAG: NAD-dependent epimerase/dehydratase family protein, partial [Thermodesulfovibrionia bacterium]|nr:NAD-dependent epimerase/dehydratase family protein [Thermodesulfovibrionia bacterium]